MNAYHHTATPTLSVIDPRALTVRSVGYCRHPDSPEIDPRITRQRFDAAGRLVESWDPRLWGTAPKPNLTTIYGLNDQPLLTDSVDAGWQLSVLDQAGSPCSLWDARGSQRHTEFDEQQRPITVTEQDAGERPRVVERLTYGDCSPAFAEHNQCGQVIRHDDPAGTQIFPDYGLAGAVLVEDRHFLVDLDTPDWPLDIADREACLEAQSFITRHIFNPTGELQEQTDAMGNVRTFAYDVAGKSSEAWLQLAGVGQSPQCLVRNIRYNAQDQIERETAGNGVLTRIEYAAEDGRLIRLLAAVENQNPLQDLNYVYDPVGNIVELHDQSQAVSHFNNQRIEPINRYRYDSLYQLVEAQGWEASQPSHGPALPTLLPTPLDPSQRRNYTQRFEYDRAGNLITRHHSDAPGFSMFTSTRSNRSLAQRDDGSLPGEPDIDSGFDAGGNQQELQRGQAMTWDSRNQLSRVTLVKRETEPDDYECYRYDRPGHRLRKTGFAHSSGRTLRSEVRYLPGLEIHRQADGEEHHVISVEAGCSNVRALHWPEGAHDDQWRYSLGDHLGSSTLELDDEAGVLTQEHYYPFGGTACWAGKSALVAQYKTIRYSGKERDATGLYYYGYRYYAPWLQRWIIPDPAWDVDGVNLFKMVRNNPVILQDVDGRMPFGKPNNKSITTGENSESSANATEPYVSAIAHNAESLAVVESSGDEASIEIPGGSVMRPDRRGPRRSNSVREISTVYRYDFRSPGEVMRSGFEGTNSDKHAFARYGSLTVFTSTLRAGADIYRKSLEKVASKKNPLFLYEISLADMEYFDFYRGFTVSGDKFIGEVSRLLFEQKSEEYMSTNKYKKIGREAFENYLFDKLRDRIVDGFVVVNELHIKGPVQPRNISPLMPPRLEYLDLAVKNYRGKSTSVSLNP
ncbi:MULTISPECIES: RHS repeat domain-containing protein [unclassified Pseudomonas]|uniref:RHS repeat domain-containing protein n=1 Tax=unclassified Pseudomonas TaxID=196821 RepID=UPI001CC0BF89|nr:MULTISPECIES: RHS repeat-associated core domain-containing protein [unclassified Pseudomonas]